MNLSNRFSKPTPYIAWLIVSAVLVTVTSAIDPHSLGFTAYGTAGVSIVLISLSLMLGMRPFLWALLAAVPTVAAFAYLYLFHWA